MGCAKKKNLCENRNKMSEHRGQGETRILLNLCSSPGCYHQNQRKPVLFFTLTFPAEKKVHFFALLYTKLGRN